MNATEATLAELLATAQAMNISLTNLNGLIARMNTGSGSSGGGAGIGGFVGAVTAATPIMRAFNVASNLVAGMFNTIGSILGKVVNGFTSTANSLVNFAKQAANGTAKLSDFYDAFKDLPFLVGTVAGIFADIIRNAESLLKVYQDITKVGASFSGNLYEMGRMATEAYMSIEDFSKIVSKNSEIFSTMGGNVDRGIRKFVDIQALLMGPKSEYARSILGLGYTANETAELLASTLNLQGNLNKKELSNNDKIAASVMNITQEMDLYAKVTGTSRELLEKDLKEKSFDAAWKTFTEGMTEEQRASATLALSKALAVGGKGAADLLKQMFMTGGEMSVAVTDASKQFLIQTNGMGDTFVKTMYNSSMNMKSGSEEQLRVQMNAARELGMSYKDFIGKFGKMGGMLSFMNNEFINNSSLMNTALKYGKMTQEEMNKAVKEAVAQEKKAASSNAANLALAENNIKIFGTQLRNIFFTFIEPIAGKLVDFGESITSTITEYVASPEFKATFDNIMNWFKNTYSTLENMYKSGGLSGLINGIFTKAFEGISIIGDTLKPFWDNTLKPKFIEIWDEMKPIILSAFDSLFDRMWASILHKLGFRTEEEKKTESSDEFQKIRSQILSEQIKSGQLMTSESELRELTYKKMKFMSEAASWGGAEDKRMWSNVNATPNPRDIRDTGTLGMTGKWWETETKPLMIHEGESVVTKDQMRQLVGSTSQEGLSHSLQQLNNLTSQLLAVMRENTDFTKRTYDATRGLSGDLFSAA